MTADLIHDVSDTALWIAGYRAQETERPDAVFHDRLANRLAGQRGLQMVAATPHSSSMAFAMVVRTVAIDRLINIGIAKGIDTVINLGAGLDTRPYRMNLPKNLRWIEVDFPQMIAYKNNLLRNKKTNCALQRIGSDLSDDRHRMSIFAQLGDESKNALIITEGVIAYLTNRQAETLSRDLFRIRSFQYWIMDYAQGFFAQNRHSKKLDGILKQTPFKFTEKRPLNFFSSHGWKIEENVFILDEADRIGRKMPRLGFPYSWLMSLFPALLRSLGNRTYGYVMFGRN